MKSKKLIALEARRDALAKKLDELDDAVIERGKDLDETEQATYDAHTTELDETTGEIDKLIKRERQLGESRKLGLELGDAANSNRGGKDEGDEELIYRADYSGEHDPLLDIFRAQVTQDPGAIQRVREHNEWMLKKVNLLRASERGDFGGLIVPEYATNEYAEIAREGRPFLNSLTSRPLTKGTVVIPVGTVGAGAGVDIINPENDAYGDADAASEPLTLSAKTIAGVAEVSVEAVEFGTLETPVLFGDMIAAYAERFDAQAWYGSGANGQHQGVLYSSGGNTPASRGHIVIDGAGVNTYREHYAAALQAAAQIRSTEKRIATHIAMSSPRWYSLMAATDLDGRPLMGMPQSMPQNVGGVAGLGFAPQIFAGLIVVVDDNIGSGEIDTKMVVYRASELVLREQNGGNPTTIRVDQAKADQGTVQFIARGFSIFSPLRRPASIAIVSGMPVPEFPFPATDDSA